MTDTTYTDGTTKSALGDRTAALLVFNGFGLIAAACLFGWVWMFHLLGEIVLWPLPIQIDVNIPGDARAFRMGHMEGITQGLRLIGLAYGRTLPAADARPAAGSVLVGDHHRVAVHPACHGAHIFRHTRACLWRRAVQAGTCQ